MSERRTITLYRCKCGSLGPVPGGVCLNMSLDAHAGIPAGERGTNEPVEFTEVGELERFLSMMSLVYPNLNDTFGYATADTERLVMDDPNEDEANTKTLIRLFRDFGFSGIVAYCGHIRDAEPIEELRTDDYRRARTALRTAGWEYEPD